uniref:FLYWCH-type domain-containing protein n=1 Tax=Ditylenchus dipsaci TaxID=166011 RepID=A0A915CTX5_9BILA
MQNNKGKPAVLCNGFVMCKAKKSADGLRQYWRCTLEKSGCLGRAISSVGSMVLKQTVPHNIHAPSPIDVKKRQTMTAMKEAAKTNLAISTAQILATAKSSLSEIEIESFGKDVNWKKTITNARKPMGGADVDKPLVEMTLNGEYVLTKSGGRFLLFDSSEVPFDLRERVPFLRRIQYQLANFYTAIPAEVVQVDEVPEEVHVNEEQVLEEVNPNYYFDATLNIYRRSS